MITQKNIIASAERSLKTYKRILFRLLHRPSPLMQSDEIAEAVLKLKSEGKIIDFGLSNFTNSQTDFIRQKNSRRL
jgi:predicted oxidoreductase